MKAEADLRLAKITDLPEITRIRTSVHENHLSVEQLTARGITENSIAERMTSGELGAWVATINSEIVAFAMADKTTGNLFALFTDPQHEGLGCGSGLLSVCEDWLRSHRLASAHLETAKGSKAEGFYARRGWTVDRSDAHDVFMAKLL
jgi:GNAT superfamily N-acetyltransferase